MKKKKILITFLLVTLQATYSQCNTETTKQNEQKHIQFLKEFYDEYISNWNDVSNDMIILNKYCSSNLIDNIHESGLEYNPFFEAQDIPVILLNHYRIEKYSEKEGLYMFSYPHDFHIEVELIEIKLGVVSTDEGLKINRVGRIRGH